jgi:hypothetical protein
MSNPACINLTIPTSEPSFLGLTIPLSVAMLSILGLIINERYKRHQNRIAVAAAMHAEISALAEITSANATVQGWENLANMLEKDSTLQIPQMYTPEPTEGIVFNTYVEKFGLLAAKDARDIILFYQYLIGIRISIKNLMNGTWDSHPNAAKVKATQIRTGLRFWNQCEEIKRRLLPSLSQTASQIFFLPMFSKSARIGSDDVKSKGGFKGATEAD